MATGTVKRDGLKNVIDIYGGINLNTLTTTGWYHGTNDGTVPLVGANDALYCLVFQDGSNVKQFIVGEFSTGTVLWMRYYNGSTWTNKRVDFADDYVNTAVASGVTQRVRGNVVTIEINGTLAVSVPSGQQTTVATLASKRPSVTVYSVISAGGGATNKYALLAVSATGSVIIYNYSGTAYNYFYGSVTYVI